MSVALIAIAKCMLISLSVDEILQSIYVNLSINLRCFFLKLELTSRLQHKKSVFLAFRNKPMHPACLLQTILPAFDKEISSDSYLFF